MNAIRIRPATLEDTPTILSFIEALAEYEKARHAVRATLQDIEQSLFCADATAHALICLLDDKPVGFAVYFYNYSTWLGRKGLYLEDLFVLPEYRGIGAGKALLKHLAQLAVSKGCGRFEWCVLDWNESAIGFYKSIGAVPLEEWTVYRLTGEALQTFAEP